jgi:3'-5' exonuclease
MSKLVIDIETIGEDFNSFDETTKDSLTKWIKTEHEEGTPEYENALTQLKDGMGFSPLTGQIVAIGMLDVEKNKGAIYYQTRGDKPEDTEENGITFRAMNEKEMLENFWKGITNYSQIITYNGRAFDIPFMNIRSAVHKIRPSMNLMPYRYANNTTHLDLYEQLTYYGATRRKGTLHLFCRAFGIESPKADGVNGDDVTALFREGKYLDIARYNVGDIRATKELYLYWEKYLKF